MKKSAFIRAEKEPILCQPQGKSTNTTEPVSKARYSREKQNFSSLLGSVTRA